ncbi:MAG: D-alanyl-D-alanine carboxypeptidase [Bacteroidetes bacterium]|nr:D-alanyl-D-alanine carboxypeptidase [Bacteroidota bacterium]
MAEQSWRWLLLLAVIAGCSPRQSLVRELRKTESEFKDHLGFVLYDPGKKKNLIEFNSDRYFTPASNTKVVTFYTSLKMLGDSIPALRYTVQNDSVIFWGTGDPSFLYGEVMASTRAYDFLRTANGRLFFSNANFQTETFGPGWAWDDYGYDYQVERSSFPAFGNRFTARKEGNSLLTEPRVFGGDVVVSPHNGARHEVVRNFSSNQLTLKPGSAGRPNEWSIPFHVSDELVVRLLTDTLRRPVGTISRKPETAAQTVYSVPADSLYKVMLQASDNFIAEQLLILCSGTLSDTLNSEKAIRYSMEHLLNDLPDKPVWVDGSGLSRYNLFTPRFFAGLWEKVGQVVPEDRLFQLVAVGGKSGTLKRFYQADRPYIFGKTGSLSNNYSLSGYLVTRKGHKLIFCWLNSNFTEQTGKIRARMELVLKDIYERY